MKDAYYFSHDSNARNDQRIMKVRMKHGMEGYGVYFGIIEIMRENSDYILYESDIESVSYDLRTDKEIVQDILYNYDLFEIRRDADIEEAFFFSKSLKRRMEALDERRQKLSEAGRKGGLSKASIEIKPPLSIKVNKSKVNKNKINKSKVKEKEYAAEIPLSLSFELFWDLYDYKQLRPDCEDIWAGKKKTKRGLMFNDEIRQIIMDHLPLYVENTHKDGEFPPRKHPKTYLNNNGWEDEVVVTEVQEKADYKLDSCGFPMAYCEVCGVSESYETDQLSGESRCHNAKLLPNKPTNKPTNVSNNGRDKNLVDQSKLYRRHIKSENSRRKEPTEIGSLIGQAIKGFEPTEDIVEEGDGQ